MYSFLSVSRYTSKHVYKNMCTMSSLKILVYSFKTGQSKFVRLFIFFHVTSAITNTKPAFQQSHIADSIFLHTSLVFTALKSCLLQKKRKKKKFYQLSIPVIQQTHHWMYSVLCVMLSLFVHLTCNYLHDESQLI